VKAAVVHMVPPGAISAAIDEALKRNDLRKALALAKIQALLSPASTASWDTYGKINYCLGERALASTYEAQCKKLDPKYASGQVLWEKQWQYYQSRQAKGIE
jgi:hypothetical protein